MGIKTEETREATDLGEGRKHASWHDCMHRTAPCLSSGAPIPAIFSLAAGSLRLCEPQLRGHLLLPLRDSL